MFNWKDGLTIGGVCVAVALAVVALMFSIEAGTWQEEIDGMREEVAVAEKSTVAMGVEVASGKTALDSLKADVAGLSGRVSSTLVEIEANRLYINEQVSGLSRKLADLQSKVSEVSFDATLVNENKADIDELRDRIASIERDIRKIQNELDLDADNDDDDDDYGDEDLIAYYNGDNGFARPPTWVRLYGDNWVGQRFETGSDDVKVETVRAYLGRGDGDAESVTMEIYKVDSDGFPTGSALCEDTVSAGNVEDWSYSGKWRKFDGDRCDLKDNTKYAVVFSSEDSNKNNFVWIGVDATGSYGDGVMVESDDGGDDWWKNSGYDIGFEIIGVW